MFAIKPPRSIVVDRSDPIRHYITMWKELFLLSRPRFWIYLFGPFIVGLAASGNNNPTAEEIILAIAFGLLFLFPANFYLYTVNDIHDIDTDKHNPKKQKYEHLFDKKNLPIVNALLALILAFSLGSTVLFLNVNIQTALFFFYFFAHYYSSPPIRAKARPFLDMVFNALYVMPALVGFFVFGGSGVRYDLVLAAIFWAMAMHAYSAIPDIEADRKAGLNTVATVLGATGTTVLCWSLYLMSAVLSFWALGWTSVILGIVYSALMLTTLLQPKKVFTYYTFFPYINFLAGAALFFTVLLF